MLRSAVWFASGKLLSSPKDPLPKHLLCLVGSVLFCNVTKSSKEAVADPTWVQSTIATIQCMTTGWGGGQIYNQMPW